MADFERGTLENGFEGRFVEVQCRLDASVESASRSFGP